VDNYLKESEHVGDNDPTAFAWRQAAIALDRKVTIAMFREFNALTRAVKAMEPESNDTKEDPLLAPQGLVARA